jgi:hypothetical protein
MRRLLGVAAAAALVLSVSAASADDVTGTISNIDLTRATFMVEGKTYVASPTNTVGTKLEDLQEGDKVRVSVTTADSTSGKQPINAMGLHKVE